MLLVHVTKLQSDNDLLLIQQNFVKINEQQM